MKEIKECIIDLFSMKKDEDKTTGKATECEFFSKNTKKEQSDNSFSNKNSGDKQEDF